MMTHALLTVVGLYLGAADGKGSDGWITMKSRLALMSTGGIRSGQVHVDTDYGVVTLYGRVATAEQKAAAEKAAPAWTASNAWKTCCR